MRNIKKVLLAILFILLCNITFFWGAEIYDSQFPDYTQYLNASDVQSYFENLIPTGQIERPELETILNGIGINNCYDDKKNDVLSCTLLAPREIDSGYLLSELANIIFVRQYYSLRFVFEQGTVTSIIVVYFHDTPLL